MKRFTYKHLLVLSGGAALLAAPVAIASSCSGQPGKLIESKTLEVIDTLRVEANSTHDNLVWPSIPSNPKVAQYLFFSGAPMTEVEAMQIAESKWVPALPKSTDFDASNRALWLKLIPASGYYFEKTVFNITALTALDKVKSKLDAASGFNLVEPANVQLFVLGNNRNALNEPKNMPSGVMFKYDTSEATGLSSEQLRTYLDAKPRSAVELKAITCYLAPTDESKYTVLNNKQAKPILSFGAFVLSAIPSPDLTQLRALKAQGEDATQVAWPSSFLISSSIDHYLFLSGDYPTRASMESAPADAWLRSLPTSLNYDHAKRNLWAKAVVAQNYEIQDPYVDLSYSSEIQTIKSVVDSAIGFEQIDLSKILILVGPSGTAQITEVASLPAGVKIVYDINNQAKLSAAELRSYLATLTRSEDFTTVSASLVPTDATKFIVRNTKLAKLTIDYLTTTASELPASDRAVLNELTALPTSLHNNVVWSQLGLFSSAVDNITFLAGDFATVEAAISASSWKSTLPSEVDFAHERRHLWARIKLAKTGIVANSYLFIDLTTSSLIQGVKSLVDTQPEYQALNLNNQVSFRGNQFNLTIAEDGAILPFGLALTYTFKGATYQTASELKVAIEKQAETLTQDDIAGITVSVKVTDAQKYVIKAPKTGTIALNSGPKETWFVLAKPINNLLGQFSLISIYGSTTLPYISVVGSNVEKRFEYKFLFGDYATEAEALKHLKEAVTIAEVKNVRLHYAHDERYLWLVIDPLPGFYSPKKVIDITEMSGVRKVITIVDFTRNYSNFDLSQVYKHNDKADIFAPLNPIFLPYGTKVVFDVEIVGAGPNTKNARFEAQEFDKGLPAYLATLSPDLAAALKKSGKIRVITMLESTDKLKFRVINFPVLDATFVVK